MKKSPLTRFRHRATQGPTVVTQQIIDTLSRQNQTPPHLPNIIQHLVSSLADGHLYYQPDSYEMQMPTSNIPIVHDEQGRFWFARYDHAEQQLAERLFAISRHTTPTSLLSNTQIAQHLQQLFPDNTQANWQTVAVAIGIQQHLMLIAGGPGTGKTTTVVKLLAALLILEPQCRIALAAPTGKAAARLSNSINQQRDRLINNGIAHSIVDKIPTEAMTLHRLIKMGSRGPFHHTDNPLALDVLIIDEASMLDLDLMLQVLQALPNDIRLILLGDPHQLAAIAPGAVFEPLCGSSQWDHTIEQQLKQWGVDIPQHADMLSTPAPLPNNVVTLTHSHRFNEHSAIGLLAQLIREGNTTAVNHWMKHAPPENTPSAWPPGITWHTQSNFHPSGPELIAEMTPYLDAVRQAIASNSQENDIQTTLVQLDQFRILCAVHDGPQGVQTVNQCLAHALRPLLSPQKQTNKQVEQNALIFPGAAILITQNKWPLGLANGDTGVLLPHPLTRDLVAWFLNHHGGIRCIPITQLPPFELAFALTIHKSQGSEFSRVALIIPQKNVNVLSRELLYTAVTRARQSLQIYADPQHFTLAITQKIERRTTLKQRLQILNLTHPTT